ncbi:MAG TPA: hypothetical protein VI756_15775 [Blastocatellia bacterium]
MSKTLLIAGLLFALVPVAACHRSAAANGPTGKPDPAFIGGLPTDAYVNPSSGVYGGTLVLGVKQQKEPSTDWERKLTQLIQASSTMTDLPTRQKYYWEAMQIWSEELPEIDLVAQNVFVAAKNNIGNLKPSPMQNFTYWNLYELYWTK